MSDTSNPGNLNVQVHLIDAVTIMKLLKLSQLKPERVLEGARWLPLILVMSLLQGCGDSSSSTSEQVLELRGQPIRQADDASSVPAAVATEAPDEVVAVEPDNPAELAGNIEVVADSQSSEDPVREVQEPSPVADAPTASSSDPAQDESGDSVAEEGDINGFKRVSFDKLAAFEFEVSDEVLNPSTEDTEALKEITESQIPKQIKDLNHIKVALKGFMLPLKVEGGLVTELLIMRDQSMCCFGTVPKINEWVSVTMVDEGVKPIMDEPITLFGRLNVGEMRENGYLVGIYSMDGESMSGPLDN